MQTEEIIRMALEAGLSMVLDDEGEKVVERFAALVAAHVVEKNRLMNHAAMEMAVAAEREACAKVCDELGLETPDTGINWNPAAQCAAVIRARSQ